MAEHLEPLSVRAKTLQNISHISNAETTPTDSQQLNRKREKIANSFTDPLGTPILQSSFNAIV
jgi:hypothetical protein